MISEREFRAEALEFLEKHAKRREPATRGPGFPDRIGLFHERDPEDELRHVAEARAWRAEVYDGGLGWISGPPEYGGRGLPPAYESIYLKLEQEFDVPDADYFGISLGMVAPTILAHAVENARRCLLPSLYRGDLIACQLFSEPAAGSDLAGIGTRAVLDGDEWILSGQKVWTSGARYADIGEIITRSEHKTSRHQGLTMFVLDMRADGVEVRPLRQMTGGAYFNEVFLSEVWVPDDMRLGEAGEGWRVALTTLMNERAAIGDGLATPAHDAPQRLLDLAHQLGSEHDPLVRQMLADVWIHHQVIGYMTLRARAGAEAGQPPGPELSLAKLAFSRNLERMSAAATRLLGPLLGADTGEWGTYAWSEFVLGVPGLRIAGGTDEIQRNVIAERVLGLPKEPRPTESPTDGGT